MKTMIAIRIEIELRNAFKAHCSRRGTSMTEVITDMINERLLEAQLKNDTGINTQLANER